METFGKRLLRLRKAAGFDKQNQFAAALGIKPSSLSELETAESKQPAAETLLRAARLLGVDPSYLLYGEGPAVRSITALADAELRLLLMFRDLSAQARLDLETEANRLHAAENSRPSRANPFPAPKRATKSPA